MKLRWSELPFNALEKIVEAYTIGALYRKTKKQATDAELIDAMLRHLSRRLQGEVFDPDDGKHHLGAVGFYSLELIKRDIERGVACQVENPYGDNTPKRTSVWRSFIGYLRRGKI